MALSSISQSIIPREEENEDIMHFPNIYEVHEVSARQNKDENTVNSRENSAPGKKHENSPISYENEETGKLQDSSDSLQNNMLLDMSTEMIDEELAQMDDILQAKRLEWKKRIETVAKGKAELLKGQKYRIQLMNKLLKESKVKKHQAMEKWAADVKTNKLKQEELQHLSQELKELYARKQKMQKKVVKYRPFEDFLMKVLDKLPDCYRSWDMNSSIKKIMDYYDLLSKSNHCLEKQMSSLFEAHRKAQKNLEALRLEQINTTLVLNTEVSSLQKKLDEVKEKNKLTKLNVHQRKGGSNIENRDLGNILLAITNMAEQCQMQHYGPLRQLDLISKLEMIQEFMLDKLKTKELADSGMFWTGEFLENYPQKVQGPSKGKFKSDISSHVSSGTIISKITVPQVEIAVKLPPPQTHCLKPLKLPNSQELQEPYFSFPRAHHLKPTPSPCTEVGQK